jgi:hypothetical protein
MGVYDLDQLKDLGMKQGWCPYFLARRVRVRHFDCNRWRIHIDAHFVHGPAMHM